MGQAYEAKRISTDKRGWMVSGPGYRRSGISKREAECIAGEMNAAFKEGAESVKGALRDLMDVSKQGEP